MAIQTRRGNEVDFDASKMLPGEWAVSLDTKYVRMCFSPGLVYRMATYESFEEDMIQIQQILATCEDIQTAVEAFEELAQQHANDAAASATASANSAMESSDSATLSESWAIGGTGTRPGEDTNNAEYWAGVAQAVADIHIATNETVGIVKGNSDEINIDAGGQMSINSSFTEQEMLTDITGEEDKKTLFGKIAKAVSDLIAHIANASIHFTLTNNLLATEAGTALDAVQGKELDTRVTANTADIATLNSKLPQSGYQIRIGSTEITCAPNATSTLSVSSLILNDFGWTQLYMLVPVLSSSIPSTLFSSYRDGVIYVYNNSAAQYDVSILYIAIGK